MHVCLICIELFGDSIYGGFGRATRFIGRELAKRGVRVSVVVPRRSPEHPDCYELDGVTVHQFRPDRPWTAFPIFRALDADVYHSQDTSTGTFLARLAAPQAVHVVTFRDPMDRYDWTIETDYANMPKLGWAKYRFFIDNPMVAIAVRRADQLCCAAEFLIPKTMAMYGLKTPPVFLPTPIDIPTQVRKADKPTFCYVGRWEGRKRVELFFELARQCPQFDFIAVGGARDPLIDGALRQRYAGIANLRMTGVLDQFHNPEWSEVLGQSWALVNTSAREGLPTTFVEAAAHRCAILSFTDPDGFASRFGVMAGEGRLAEGLAELLQADSWQALAEKGWFYVQRVFATENAIRAHLELYEKLLRDKQGRR